MEKYPLHPEIYPKLLKTIGSKEMAVASERRHVVTYADVGPVWFNKEKSATLPLTVRANGGPAFARVRVGEVPENAKVEIRLGATVDKPDALTVFMNSEACEYARTEKVVPAYTHNPALVYSVKNDGKLSPFFVIEMLGGSEDVTIDYMEVHVMPGE